jgi:hypothetical protein
MARALKRVVLYALAAMHGKIWKPKNGADGAARNGYFRFFFTLMRRRTRTI